MNANRLSFFLEEISSQVKTFFSVENQLSVVELFVF